MKPIARQRRQPCVLGRYPQPVFFKCQPAALAQAVVNARSTPRLWGGRRVVFKGGAALSQRLIMLALTNVGLVWLLQGGQDETTLIRRAA
jgi:hypothetical protein